MADGAGDEQTLTRYAAAQARLEARGGYLWRNRASDTAHGLGFRDERPRRHAGHLLRGRADARLAGAGAGDGRRRAAARRAHQPSRHRLAGVARADAPRWTRPSCWSPTTAGSWRRSGPPCSSCRPGGRFFAGSWHQWRREQAARELALGRAIEAQQAEIERMERFIERFRYKASKARQAQSRVKKLDKMERIERDPKDGRSLEFAFATPRALRPRDLRAAGRPRGGRGGGEPPVTLLQHAELWLERGEHVSLVGPNGAGKTTLIEVLAGRRELPEGKLSTGHNVKVGYLSQHAEELGAGGPPEQSVLDAAQRATGLTPGKARALLGRFLFSGEEAEKPLAGLSGGERRRLSLAVLVGRRQAAQRPDPRRAHQPPRHREPRGARGRPARLRGCGPARLPRPCPARRRRHAHDRRRGRHPAQLPRRLGRVRARARGARWPRAGRASGGAPRGAAPDGPGRRRATAPAGRRRRGAHAGDGGAERGPAAGGAQPKPKAKPRALQEPPPRAAEGRGGGRSGRSIAARAGSRAGSSRRRGRPATRRPSPRLATRPPGAPSRPPTSGCRSYRAVARAGLAAARRARRALAVRA